MNQESEVKNQESVELQKQCEEYLAGWKRAQADYQNLQKQLAREREEYARHALALAVEHFLPAVDHLNEAMSHKPTVENFQNWVAGISHIQNQFAEILKELGLARIEAVGKQFDPARHESVGMRDDPAALAGAVLEEKQPGYELNGKVLRPAKVIINSSANN